MTVENLSRRDFLKIGALAGGGLVLGVFVPGTARAQDAGFAPNAFVRVAPDGTVTVVCAHSEMGQGTYTSAAMVVADELDADWTKVRAVSAPVDHVYDAPNFHMQATGGSSSTWGDFDRLRQAGAAARFMLVAAAAELWSVDAATLKTDNGRVLDASGKSATYGELAERASKKTPPAEVAVKDSKDWKLIGHDVNRVDSLEKSTGKAQFAIDVSLPGMLVAVVARAPVFGATKKSLLADKARAVPGVRHVVEIERGVAVVADGFWAAKQGREALEIVWNDGPLAALDSKTQGDEYAALAREPGVVARNDGDAAAFGAAATKLEATYEVPYLAHAPMEPLNCVASVGPNACDIWVGTQFQTVDRDNAARVSGLKPEQVNLRTTFLGGGFGRRATFDSHVVCEAVEVSKAVKAPVKVIWTREDDTRGGFYRPRFYHAIRAGLDGSKKPVAWEHRLVSQSFGIGSPFEKFLIRDGVDVTAVEGAKELPYAVPNVRVTWQHAPEGVPVHFWRSVGHSSNAFVVESFIDELAHAAGADPFEFRRGLLEGRHKRLLELVAEKAGWGKPLEKGRGRGIAVHESFGSLVAHVVEASVGKDGRPRVHRVVAAVDCGAVVNPHTVRAQVQGGTIFGLSAALFGEITFAKGRVKQSNFHDYPMLRMHEAPEIEVHVAPSGDKMGGIGEPGVPPVAPALANALFAATGKRIRRLPFRAVDFVS